MPDKPLTFFGFNEEKAEAQRDDSAEQSEIEDNAIDVILPNYESDSSHTLMSDLLSPLTFFDNPQGNVQTQLQCGEQALILGKRAEAQQWFTKAAQPYCVATGEQQENGEAYFMLGYLAYLEGMDKESVIDKQIAFCQAEKHIQKAQSLGSEYVQANTYLINKLKILLEENFNLMQTISQHNA